MNAPLGEKVEIACEPADERMVPDPDTEDVWETPVVGHPTTDDEDADEIDTNSDGDAATRS